MNTVRQNPKAGVDALFPYMIDPLAAICISYLVHPYYDVVDELDTLPEAANLYFEKCLTADCGLIVKVPDCIKIPLFVGLFSTHRRKVRQSRVSWLLRRILDEVKLYGDGKEVGTVFDAKLSMHYDCKVRMPIFYFEYNPVEWYDFA